MALCFSYVTFLSPIGLQFWLLNAALHAADVQSRGRAVGRRGGGPAAAAVAPAVAPGPGRDMTRRDPGRFQRPAPPRPRPPGLEPVHAGVQKRFARAS